MVCWSRTLLWPPCSSLTTKQLAFLVPMSENSLRLVFLEVSVVLASMKNSFSFIIWEIELQPKTIAEWMVTSKRYKPTFYGSNSFVRLQTRLKTIVYSLFTVSFSFSMRTLPMQNFLPKEILYSSSVLLLIKLFASRSVSFSSSRGFSDDCDNFCIIWRQFLTDLWISDLRF